MKPTKQPAEEKELQIYIAKLERENEIMSKLSTSSGFYKYYFSKLPNFETQKKCFDFVNKQYCLLFGELRYDSYEHFKILTN